MPGQKNWRFSLRSDHQRCRAIGGIEDILVAGFVINNRTGAPGGASLFEKMQLIAEFETVQFRKSMVGIEGQNYG